MGRGGHGECMHSPVGALPARAVAAGPSDVALADVFVGAGTALAAAVRARSGGVLHERGQGHGRCCELHGASGHRAIKSTREKTRPAFLEEEKTGTETTGRWQDAQSPRKPVSRNAPEKKKATQKEQKNNKRRVTSGGSYASGVGDGTAPKPPPRRRRRAIAIRC